MILDFIKSVIGKHDAMRLWPALPAGQRVYAIGDVHGRADLLEMMIARIERDEATRAAKDTTLVLLGDLVDRGPDSARVIDLVLELSARRKVRAIAGNHEEMLLASLGSDAILRRFLEHGGRETILSYLGDRDAYNRLTISELRAQLATIIPPEHLAFLRNMEEMVSIGSYAFVHAGIRPGVALPDQTGHDLRWIREDFLQARDDLGAIVVHGHTICQNIDIRSNRIGIDTGAYLHGRLTALALEDDERWFIEATA